MEIKIDAGFLVVRIPLNPTPVASKTGKTRVIASTHGNVKTALLYKGAPVTLGLNAYIPSGTSGTGLVPEAE